MTEPVTFVLYSQPTCYPCKAVKRELDKLGADYEVRDITTHPEARVEVLALGYQGTPVVLTSAGEHWHGHRPGRIAAALAAGAPPKTEEED